MPAARPYLASARRRVLAFVLDTGVLLLAALVVFGVIDSIGQNPLHLVWILPMLYFAYHTAILKNQKLAFGRVVAAILVVSARGADLTSTQALVRTATRALLFALGMVAGVLSHEPWVVVVPCAIEVALIAATPWRQSIADLLAGTLVVQAPQVQPHRAPAAPMFSATDSEFGIPPKWLR